MTPKENTRPRRTVSTGHGYLEAGRWFDGHLYFSEMKFKQVKRLKDTGAGTGEEANVEVVTDVPTRPSGLGWLPDGSLLIVSQGDDSLLKLAPGSSSAPEKVSELAPHAIHANDMAVSKTGVAYISHFGFDWFKGEKQKPSGLVVRHPDGRVELSGQGLEFPNGVAVSADGKTLFVSESFGNPLTRLTAFEIKPDGSLGAQRVVKEFGPPDTHVVDGICIDVEDGVWVSLCSLGEYQRVLPDGTVTDVIRIPKEGGNYVVDSALGGPDGKTLYMLIADATVETINAGFQTTARIDAIAVDVAGVPLK